MVQGLFRKKILITGASGFVGANLARFLVNNGLSPHVFVRKDSDLWRIKDILGRIKVHILDISDGSATRVAVSRLKPEVVLHCAAYGGYHFQLDRDKIIRTNLIGTINLLSACIKNGCECFINTGSSSEYGLKNKPMRESDLLEPVTDYAAAKAAATLFCGAIAKREKIPIVTLRLFSAYGPYEQGHRLIPSLILSCLKKDNPKLSSGSPVRDFVFIEDVVNAYMKAIAHKDKLSGEIINIGSAREYSVREAAEKIIALSPHKVKPLWKKVVNPRIEPHRWQADITKARKLLGWKPLFTFERGLKKSLEWFSENAGLYNGKKI
ncbi:NAD-dependent epimerase/dehydratase family protein [bacterium]|nr:MAG: NAD-dependent epimerase/dehydratase family protein [bacterium]